MITYVRDLALAATALGLAWAAGARVLRLTRLPTRGGLERFLLSLAVGFALTSYLLFAVGSLVRIDFPVVASVLGVVALVGLGSWRTVASAARPLSQWWRSAPWRHARFGAGTLLAGLIAVTATMNLLGALAPPTEWDSLDHHLGAVKYFIDHGWITFVPYRAWQAPFTAEMWNMLGLLLGSERLPQVFQWAMGLASAGALYVLSTARISSRVGLLAAAMYYTSPHVFSLSTSAKSDLAWLTFLFLSLHCLLAWRERRDARWLWLSALFTGLGLGTKYQGLLWAAGICLAVLALQHRGLTRKPFRVAGRTIGYAAVSVLIASPWWLRNYIAGGDPIWPYGYPLFGSRFWTQQLYDKYAAWQAGPGTGASHYFAGLWNLTVRQGLWEFGLIVPVTPLILAFSPSVLVARRLASPDGRRLLAVIGVIAVVYYTLWFHAYQQTRYLLPALALLMIVAAYGYWGTAHLRVLRTVGSSFMLIVFLFLLSLNVAFNMQFARVVFGMETRENFLRRNVSFFDDVAWINANLPDGSRVLFFHPKTFYLDRDFVRGDWNLWPVDEATTADDYLAMMRDRGITHVFVTGSVIVDPEYAEPMGLLSQLEARGRLVTVYWNPRAVQVESRTLGRSRPTTAEVLVVVAPRAEPPDGIPMP